MALRAGHGNGAGQPRVEVRPANEQPRAQAAGADPIVSGRDAAGKLRTSAAARALAKLPRRSRYVPRKLALDPRFAPHNASRLEWRRKRTSELHAAHGGVSHGVGAMLSAAAWLYSAGEFAAELAAESGNVEGFKQAASLTSTARQHELAAWELCAREAVNHKRTRPNVLAELFTEDEPEQDDTEQDGPAIETDPSPPTPEPVSEQDAPQPAAGSTTVTALGSGGRHA